MTRRRGPDTPSVTEAFFGELGARGHQPLLKNASGTVRFDLVDGERAEHWHVTMRDGDIKGSSSPRATWGWSFCSSGSSRGRPAATPPIRPQAGAGAKRRDRRLGADPRREHVRRQRRPGDIEASPSDPTGLFSYDTRFLPRWVLTISGQRPSLSTDDLHYFRARFFLVPGRGSVYVNSTLTVIRERAVGDGFCYNPIGHHVGTIWPFDNSFIAWGLRRYGFRAEAARVAAGILDATEFFEGRLPEVFGGYPRTLTKYPVRYPTACTPQAWSTGAPLLLLRTMLGLEPIGEQLVVDPALPNRIGRLELLDIPGRWGRVDAFGRRIKV